MYAPWNSCSLRKNALNQEEENPKWQEHTLLLSLAAMDLQNGKGNSKEVGGLFIGLALEASCWKKSPEKVVPLDEPMVPPAERRIIRSLIRANMVVEPWNPDNTPTLYTDAPSDHLVLKAPHLGQFCLIWIKPSDEPIVPSIQASVHLVLKQKSWRVSVRFKCYRRMNH
jgi:hypothetical protein